MENFSLIEIIVRWIKDPSSLTEEELKYVESRFKQYTAPLPTNNK